MSISLSVVYYGWIDAEYEGWMRHGEWDMGNVKREVCPI